jgi:membrane protein
MNNIKQIWNNLLDASGYKCRVLSYPVMLVILVACMIHSFRNVGILDAFPDTATYLRAGDNLMNFTLDVLRTPVYPLILAALKAISGLTYLPVAVAILQWLVFLIAIPYFYKLSMALIRSRKFVFWCVCFFAIDPYVYGFNNLMLTESLSISGLVFLVYCAAKCFQRPSAKYILWYTFWCLFLLFLRPAYVYLMAVYVIFIIMLILRFSSESKRAIITAVVGCIVVFSSYYSYKSEIRRLYGINSITIVSDYNKFHMLLARDLFKSKYATNPVTREKLEKACIDTIQGPDRSTFGPVYCRAMKGLKSLSMPELDQYVSDVINQNKGRMIIGTLSRACRYTLLDNSLCCYTSNPIRFNLRVTFEVWLYFGLCYLGCLIYAMVKARRLAFVSIFVFVISGASFCVGLFGAETENARLFISGLPFLILMFFQLLSQTKLKQQGEGLIV